MGDTFLWYVKNLWPDIWRPAGHVPPWYSPACRGRRYDGRSNWWADAGYKDPLSEQGRWGFFPFAAKEDDPFWTDPPVKDGESRFGPAGKDTQIIGGQGLLDQTNPEEWRKYMYFNNPTIKDIYKKWDISKEHPGMHYMPDLINSNYYTDPKQVGRVIMNQPLMGPPFEYDILHRGPKFFDAPFGEKCFSKMFAISKWILIFGSIYTAHDIAVMNRHIKGPKRIMLKYLKNMHMPVSMAVTWTAVSCLTCSRRGVDDYKNGIVGSIAAGTVFGSRHGFFMGAMAAFWIGVISLGFFCARTGEFGLSFKNVAKQHSDSPLLWQHTILNKNPTKPVYDY